MAFFSSTVVRLRTSSYVPLDPASSVLLATLQSNSGALCSDRLHADRANSMRLLDALRNFPSRLPISNWIRNPRLAFLSSSLFLLPLRLLFPPRAIIDPFLLLFASPLSSSTLAAAAGRLGFHAEFSRLLLLLLLLLLLGGANRRGRTARLGGRALGRRGRTLG